VHGRETHPLKGNIDKALKESGHEVDWIFVASRTGKKVPMTPGRDFSLEKVTLHLLLTSVLIVKM